MKRISFILLTLLFVAACSPTTNVTPVPDGCEGLTGHQWLVVSAPQPLLFQVGDKINWSTTTITGDKMYNCQWDTTLAAWSLRDFSNQYLLGCQNITATSATLVQNGVLDSLPAYQLIKIQ